MLSSFFPRIGRLSFQSAAVLSIAVFTLCLLYTLIQAPSSIANRKKDFYTSSTSSDIWFSRSEKVKESFQHAYHGYERYALPHDELTPISKAGSNVFNRWGVTVFDSLDTMMLMGLNEEFNRSMVFVSQATFDLPPGVAAPFFEAVIRYLGGLLSAYALADSGSTKDILKNQADKLGSALSPAFDSMSGFPWYSVNIASGKGIGTEIGTLAEIASCQMEYTYLAKVTGKKEYFGYVDKIIKILTSTNLDAFGGMAPVLWNITSGLPYNTHLSVGARGDSTHEYILKHYLLTAKTDPNSLNMYIKTTNNIISKLLFLSEKRRLLYVTDVFDQQPRHTMDHLSCFLPGLFALGAHTLPLHDIRPSPTSIPYGLSGFNLRDLHMWAAEGLAKTCFQLYADQPSKLAPEEVYFMKGGTPWVDALSMWKERGSRGPPPGTPDKTDVIYDEIEKTKGPKMGHERDYVLKGSSYFLRPETIESLYIMWRVTGESHWRERGWAIFEAIERESRTSTGYATLLSVDSSPAVHQDYMPSYLLAETLKYLYLMFLPHDPISLDKWVFNTEAHPLPVFEWTDSEKTAFGIL